MTTVESTSSAFVREWHEWHDALDAERRRPHGFLAYASFDLLGPEPRRYPHLPGRWSTGPDGPVVVLDDGEVISVGGVEVRDEHRWGPIGERTFHRVLWHDAAIEVSKRGGLDIVRLIDPRHALRERFDGTPAYPPSPDWVIEATFEPNAPRAIAIEAAIPVIEHEHVTTGSLRFVVAGASFTATLIDRSPGLATLLFRDATSGITTYAASRALAVELPAQGDRVLLDFNRATNLQCAYTDFAPCPLAPRENWLTVAIEAGEQTPLQRNA